jgi:hypothetical protein
MGAERSEYIIYGIRFERNDLTEEQIEEFYEKYNHSRKDMVGKVTFINSGMSGYHYWLGYVVDCTDEKSGLEVTLDDKTFNQAVIGMAMFLKDNKLRHFEDTHRLYFHVITRWS